MFSIVVYVFAIIGFAMVGGFFAVKWGLTNEPGVIDNQRESFMKAGSDSADLKTVPDWAMGEEWQTFVAAVIKDKKELDKAGSAADITPRLLVAQLAVEQLRLFHTNREIFKKIFEPLKILGNQSQFSWGIMGIKRETAVQIENNLKNENSDFYPGKKYEKLLDFATADKEAERFKRLTDEEDHYWTYLYGALYLKEIAVEWEKAGYDIKNRPEILSTLFNIGFERSKPNGNPSSGGALIEIRGKAYSFGALADDFYRSNELREYFPI